MIKHKCWVRENVNNCLSGDWFTATLTMWNHHTVQRWWALIIDQFGTLDFMSISCMYPCHIDFRWGYYATMFFFIHMHVVSYAMNASEQQWYWLLYWQQIQYLQQSQSHLYQETQCHRCGDWAYLQTILTSHDVGSTLLCVATLFYCQFQFFLSLCLQDWTFGVGHIE